MKPLIWLGSTLKDLKALPKQVQRSIGRSLLAAQMGDIDHATKPLKGFGGAHVMEISISYQSNAFRSVFAMQFPEAIYVLHVFQKKSRSGIATPQQDIDLIKRRLADAHRLSMEGDHGGGH
jgi:phage-related protein